MYGDTVLHEHASEVAMAKVEAAVLTKKEATTSKNESKK
jgi:hypothetical protein